MVLASWKKPKTIVYCTSLHSMNCFILRFVHPLPDVSRAAIATATPHAANGQ